MTQIQRTLQTFLDGPRFTRLTTTMTTTLLPQALIIGVMLGGFLWSWPTGAMVVNAPVAQDVVAPVGR